MSSGLGMSVLEEFGRIRAAVVNSTEVAIVVAKGDSVYCLKKNGEVIYDLGDGQVKRINLKKGPCEKAVFAVDELAYAIRQSHS